MNLLKDNRAINSGDELGSALLHMLDENLDIKHFGFHQTFSNFMKTSNLKVIYNSEWCRIKFVFSRQQLPSHDELSIEYGRLHAPDEEPFMVWHGEKCRCWHNFLDPLRFLDGLSPAEALQQAKVDKQLPDVVRKYRDSELGKKFLAQYPPKSSVALQSILWNHYGNRLFELFDLRHPDIWKDYSCFITEYYDLLEMKASYGPPYESIC